MNITVHQERLTDGSYVYNVTVNQDGATIQYDAVDEAAAHAFAEALQAAARQHTLTSPGILYAYRVEA